MDRSVVGTAGGIGLLNQLRRFVFGRHILIAEYAKYLIIGHLVCQSVAAKHESLIAINLNRILADTELYVFLLADKNCNLVVFYMVASYLGNLAAFAQINTAVAGRCVVCLIVLDNKYCGSRAYTVVSGLFKRLVVNTIVGVRHCIGQSICQI